MENDEKVAKFSLKTFTNAGDYFDAAIKFEDGSIRRKCKLCSEDRFIRVTGQNTSGLITHLKSTFHKMTFETNGDGKKQRK